MNYFNYMQISYEIKIVNFNQINLNLKIYFLFSIEIYMKNIKIVKFNENKKLHYKKSNKKKNI